MFVGDIGTAIILTVKDQDNVAVDISPATVMTMKFKKPDGSVTPRTAVLNTNGLDGKMKYVTIAGDINMSGGWSCQGVVTLPTGTWTTSSTNFSVMSVL